MILKTPGLGATFITQIAAFGGWTLLLPVIPLAVVNNGGSATLAGLHTGLFMIATVLTQMCMPRVLRILGYVPVIILAALLLGIPSLLYFHSLSLGIAIIRGIGFGGLTVASSALVAELAPREKLSQTVGISGLCIGFSQVLAFFIGLSLPFSAVIWLVTIMCTAAALCALKIPRIIPKKEKHRRKNILPGAVPAAAMGLSAMGFGALSSFLPASILILDPELGSHLAGIILSIVTFFGMCARYIAGRFPRVLFLPSLLGGGIGLCLISFSLSLEASLWFVLGGAILFGFGFGVVQNEALVMFFDRLPRPEASALWNMSFDGGTGLGSIMLGYLIPLFAYSSAFGAAGVCVFIAFIIVMMDRVDRSSGGSVDIKI